MSEAQIRNAISGKTKASGGLNIPEIKEILSKYNLPTDGNRSDLNDRLGTVLEIMASEPVASLVPAPMIAPRPKPRPRPRPVPEPEPEPEPSIVPRPRPIPRPRPVPNIDPVPEPSVARKLSVAEGGPDLDLDRVARRAEQEAERLGIREKDAFVADHLRLHLNLNTPKVPVKHRIISPQLRVNCEACFNHIKNVRCLRPEHFGKMAVLCAECQRQISSQYIQDQKDNNNRYKNYHGKGPLDLEKIIKFAGNDGFYNQTMYDAAGHWKSVADRRLLDNLPPPPK